MFFLAFAEGSIQLLPDGTLLIHIAMILVMIWILNRTFFRPINRIISAREKNKGGHFTEAEAILNEADEKKSEYTKALQGSRSEAYELIEKQRSEAIALKQKNIDSAKTEVSRMVEAENVEMERQIAGARKEIAVSAEQMAETISSNILKGARG